jgi:inner membrane protein
MRRATQPQWKAYLAAATLGYGTHGLLDASTTYGTRLWWPFSDVRVAWNWISIVDPVFTTMLLAGAFFAVWRRSARPLAVALALCAACLAAGAAQRERALQVQERIAAGRGHVRDEGAVFPGFGNAVIWRSLYTSNGRLHMDRIRVPPFGAPSWSPGPSVEALDAAGAPGQPPLRAEHTRDLRRFRQFANGWIAAAPGEPDLIGDARYSMRADAFVPVWGIRLLTGPGPPFVEWVDRSARRRVDVRQLLREVWGRDESYGAVGR